MMIPRIPTAGSAFHWALTITLLLGLAAVVARGVAQRTGPVWRSEPGYWLNSATGVRHNAECVYYGKTKRGGPCGPDDGLACGLCGG